MTTISGTSANDSLTGGFGDDTILAGDGDDTVDGGGGADALYGEAGDDRFAFSTVVSSNVASPLGIIDGGDGFDTIDARNVSPVALSLSDGGQLVFAVGSQQFDVSGVEQIMLGDGVDYSYLGIDPVPAVQLRFGGGNDVYIGGGNIRAYGEDGDDQFFISGAYDTPRDGLVDGGAGIDMLQLNIGFTVDLAAGTAMAGLATYSVAGFENVRATTNGFATSVAGDDGDNRLTVWDYYDDGRAGVTFDGRGGNDTLIGSSGADVLRGGDGSDWIDGALGDDVLDGGAGDDYLTGDDGSDTLYGGDGNDLLSGGLGADTITGGAGIDRVVYQDFTRRYVMSAFSGTTGTVAGSYDSDDRLTGVEYINFRDGYLTFDPDANVAKLMRLYDAVLGRAPDAPGLDAWVGALDGGVTLRDAAQAFLGSPEFQQATGSLSNADFIEYVYNHALGRASDPAGKAAWTAELYRGASRADVLLGFSESDEHRALTSDRLGQGLFVTDDVYQQVAALYDTFANRLPDAGGLEAWTGEIKSGRATLAQVADSFASSEEFQSRIDGFSNAQLVEFMYVNSLDRSSDAGGKAAWTAELDRGLSRGGLLLAFSQSNEHLMLISGDIQNGIAIG